MEIYWKFGCDAVNMHESSVAKSKDTGTLL